MADTRAEFPRNLEVVWERSKSFKHVRGGAAEVHRESLAVSIDAEEAAYTPLNDSVYELHSPEDGKFEMEIVFFHGLRIQNYHNAYIDTWMTSSEPSVCWIKAWLPQRFPRARILSVSYDSSATEDASHGRFDLHLLAENLAQNIISSAKVGQQFGTPVMLVGHCVGGLVIKNLCLHVGHISCTVDKEARASFVENVMGVFFFATPHHGMRFKSLEQPGPLATSLQVLADSTARLNEDFERLRRSYHWMLHGVGESLPTRLAEFEGVFAEEVRMVEEASARPYLDRFMCVAEDHFSICRPRDMQSSTFDALCRFLEDMLKRAEVRSPPASLQQLPKVLVGLEKHVDLLEPKLQSGDTMALNIWGMGGIGKTTLAKSLFNRISTSFEYSVFIESSSHNHSFTMETVCSNHLYRRGKKFSGGKPEDLYSRTVLFVFDDVRCKMSLNDPVNIWYNEMAKSQLDGTRIDIPGSRLIVTSREQQVLARSDLESHTCTYRMALLNEEESYKLLVTHAFPSSDPVPVTLSAYRDADGIEQNLVRTVSGKCDGLPLTLEVIGKSLAYEPSRAEPEVWEYYLGRLDKASVSDDELDTTLWKKLKLSYDAINQDEQQMFLDAATIFNGLPLSLAEATWSTTFKNLSSVNWNHLISKSLVYGSAEKDGNEIIKMHEQLRSLGRYVSDSQEESSSRRRIWKSEDAWDGVINARTADEPALDEKLTKIHGFRFHFSDLPLKSRMGLLQGGLDEKQNPSVSQGGKVFRVSSSLFCKMTSLKYLLLEGVDVVGSDKKKFSKSLETLIWSSGARFSEFPALSNPGQVSNLTVLQLQCVHLKSLDTLTSGSFPHLKILELRSAKSLEKIPDDIHRLKMLGRLSFFQCPKLKDIPSSVGRLGSLEHLVFWDCQNLRTLPAELSKLHKLKRLILSRCCSLESLPKSIGSLASLKILDLHRCSNLQELPQSITDLSSLQTLNISGKFRKLPDSFGDGLQALTNLKLKYCVNLESLPPVTFKSCSNLERLQILHCYRLRTLPGPDTFEGLKNLKRVLLGWVAVEGGVDGLERIWSENGVDFNVRGWLGPGVASHSELEDDAISVMEDLNQPPQDEEVEFQSFSSRVSTDRYVKGEYMNHRYLALESVHNSLQRIVVEVESHDQGWSSNPSAHGTKLDANSYGELSVRNPEGLELARIVLFRNLHAVWEWQMHHVEVENPTFLDLVEPGHVVELWLRTQYLAWEIHAKYGSLQLVSTDAPQAESEGVPDRRERSLQSELSSPESHHPLSSRVSTDRYVSGEYMNHLYLAVESVHKSLQRIVVEVESHDQGWSGNPSAHGTKIDANSYGELSVRSPEGLELARIEVFRNLHAVWEWQPHHFEVEDPLFLALVEPGHIVELWLRTQYRAWEIHAKSGSLELISTDTPQPGSEVVPDVRENCFSHLSHLSYFLLRFIQSICSFAY